MLLSNPNYLSDLHKNLSSVLEIKKLRNQRILITGITGLIGSCIADLLLIANQQLHLDISLSFASRSIEKINKRFQPFQDAYTPIIFDLNHEFQCSDKFDLIIHCASSADPTSYAQFPVEIITGGINGAAQLLQKLTPTGRFVYISSSEVYGNNPGDHLITETDNFAIDFTNPRSCYPISKQCVESLCASYRLEYGLDYVVCRPGHIYGPTMTPTDSRASSAFLRNALSKQDIIMKSAGTQLRSYCHVIDCATAILSTATSGATGEAYNISNHNSIVTIRDFATACAKASGCQIQFAAPSASEQASFNLMTYSALDATKLEQLGWQGKYNLQQGIEETLAILSVN